MTHSDGSGSRGEGPQPDPAGSAGMGMPDRGYRRDLRRYASQTSIQLAVGMLILLLTVGNGLVYLIYGPGALLTSLTCMLSFALPVVLIAILLWMLGGVARRGRDD